MFEKFNQAFGFTTTEGRVVVFLVATFVAGLGIKVVKNSSISSSKFDYSAADSEFTARSRSPDTGTSAAQGNMQPPQRSAEGKQRPGAVVDLNSATKAELILLPGIGEVMAERIIQYRKEHGKFSTVEDLLKVKGIGKKKLERIKPHCTVR